MVEENQPPKEDIVQKIIKPEKSDKLSLKVLIVGVPIFIIQLIAVYFITANILLDKIKGTQSDQVDSAEVAVNEENIDTAEDDSASIKQTDFTIGKFIYSVDDIIVNPAGTNGQQLLLTSIAFDLGKEEDLKNLQGKEVVVKDMIISVLSSKNISKLSNTTYKDSLKFEISSKLHDFLPDVKVNKVYFSKYIIN